MNRQELIKKGKIWQVYPDTNADNILFEGNKTSCFKFVKQKYGMSQYKKGIIRVGKLIWEKTSEIKD